MLRNQLIVTLIVTLLSGNIKAQESTTIKVTTESELESTSTISTTTELIVEVKTQESESTTDYNLTETINDLTTTELSETPSPTTTESSEIKTTIKPIEIVDYSSELFNRDCLNAHNQLRSRHGVGPLKIDNNIINFAQARAATLASLNDTSYLLHEASSYGENLAAWPLIASKPIVNCSDVVSIWFDEYKYVSNWSSDESFTPYTYHFTQIVWSSTDSLGCGAAAIKGSDWLFICCNYNPPGNYLNSFVDHVKPPIDQSVFNETINEVHHPTQIGKNCKCTCQVEL